MIHVRFIIAMTTACVYSTLREPCAVADEVPVLGAATVATAVAVVGVRCVAAGMGVTAIGATLAGTGTGTGTGAAVAVTATGVVLAGLNGLAATSRRG